MSKSENTEPENFLARWSSRKLAERKQSARQGAPGEHAPSDENGGVNNGAVDKSPKSETQNNQPFDPAQLPPLDSIGADTNIADFLRRGVPPDLTRAALRRAWTSDPAIKNFVGLVENGWDFNDPSAIAGFGQISPEEVARLAGKLIETLPTEPEDQASVKEVTPQRENTEILPEGSLEAIAKTDKAAEAGGGDDAAQQNKTANENCSRDASDGLPQPPRP